MNPLHPLLQSFLDYSDNPGLKWRKIQRRIKVTRERDIAAALKLIGGVRVRGCPVGGVGDNVNLWVIRDHEKYKNHTAKELGKLYVGFYTDSSYAKG